MTGNEATDFLATIDPAWAALVARVGPCGWRPQRREPFEALVRAVAHQQLHSVAAERILGRLMALDGAFPSPDALLAWDDAALRGCGFSGGKLAALRDIAARTLDGTVPTLGEADLLADDELITRLVSIRGVGRWTVEMVLISTLGRPDVLPVDDFGVREGYRRLHGLDGQPTPKALTAIGAAWAPHRTTASWYLWRSADEGKKIKQPI